MLWAGWDFEWAGCKMLKRAQVYIMFWLNYNALSCGLVYFPLEIVDIIQAVITLRSY